jgi:hypothetical protein
VGCGCGRGGSGVGATTPERGAIEHQVALGGLEAGLEESQVLGLGGEAQADHALGLFEERDDGFGGHVHVRLRVDAPRDREADQLELGEDVLARVGVAPAETAPRSMVRTPDSTYSAAASACAGNLIARDVGQELERVEEHAVPADGADDGNARLSSRPPRYSTWPMRARMWSYCTDSRCRSPCFHVATREPAVGVQALEEHDHVAGFLGERIVVDAQEAADVDEAVLLR